MEYLRPVGVMARELGRHLQRCLKHEDVARQLTLRDLNLACEQWVCESLRELTEEMEMWKWDNTLGNKWARIAKCSQLLNIPLEMAGDTKMERKGTSCAKATRELRRLRHRIEEVGGSWRLEIGTRRQRQVGSQSKHRRLYTKVGGRSGSATSSSRLGRSAGDQICGA